MDFFSGVNFLIRKMAGMARPVSEIKVIGDQIHITTNAGFTTNEDVYKLNEECDREHQGMKQKVSKSTPRLQTTIASRKHACIILTPLNPTFM